MGKKVVLYILASIILISCNMINYQEVYSLTDEVIEMLQNEYESFGLFGGMDFVKYTKDNEYKVTPIGRMINVRIEHPAELEEYEDLRDALKSHYSGDSRVNDVFINELGTIMIDCRN